MFLIGEGDFIMTKSLIIQEKIATDPNSLANRILQKLMRPAELSDTTNINFEFVSKDEIYSIIETAEELFKNDSIVLDIRSPAKIFGDIHGQLADLMRLFKEFGAPNI